MLSTKIKNPKKLNQDKEPKEPRNELNQDKAPKEPINALNHDKEPKEPSMH